MNVANSIALVTGANGGLGQYYIEALRSRGVAKIYAGARNPKALESLVTDHPDIVIPIALDITDEESVDRAAAQCPDVTLLINNAGVGFDRGLLAAPDLSRARMEMDVNYFGTLMMCRLSSPHRSAVHDGRIRIQISQRAR